MTVFPVPMSAPAPLDRRDIRDRPAPGHGPGAIHLRLLATTDLHVHLLAWDYFAARSLPGLGLERTARLIAAARAEAPNCLLLDNGDFLQGSPLGDHAARQGGRRAAGALHPAIAAMNALGYDAAALGNHEFDHGLDFLLRALDGAAFPVLCANLVRSRGRRPTDDLPLLAPCTVIERRVTDAAGRPRTLRIGLIGLAPPQTLDWDGAALRGRLEARDILQTARAWVPRLRAQGADLVVALAHTGIGPPQPGRGAEDAAALAALPGIDAVIAGHDHLVFPGPRYAGLPGADPLRGLIAGTPVVMAGYGGSHLGVIDLILERGPAGWRPACARAEARPVPRGPLLRQGDPVVRGAVLAAHRATVRRLRRPVGSTPVPLHSFFALVADCPALRLVCAAQARHVRAALAGGAHAHLPVLSAAAPFKAGGRGGPDNYTDVPAGPVALRNVADLYAFPNALRAVRVTGADLAEWLERSAALFLQLRPGLPDQPLIDPDFRSHNFDVIDGLTYAIDPTAPARYDPEGRLIAPAARRVRDLCHAGRPVAPDAEFVVATNSHRLGLGLRDGAARLVLEGSATNRDILLRHIAAGGTAPPAAAPGWRLTGPPGTSGLFDTSPRARAHLRAQPGVVLEDAGDAPGGFARIRIRL